MSLYTNYIEGVYIFYFLSSLSNLTVYKEVRVLKKGRIEDREKKQSSVGRFQIFSSLRSV